MKFRTGSIVLKFVAFHLFCLNPEGCRLPRFFHSFIPGWTEACGPIASLLTIFYYYFFLLEKVCVCVSPFVYICPFGHRLSSLKSPSFFQYVTKGQLSFKTGYVRVVWVCAERMRNKQGTHYSGGSEWEFLEAQSLLVQVIATPPSSSPTLLSAVPTVSPRQTSVKSQMSRFQHLAFSPEFCMICPRHFPLLNVSF